MKIRKMTVADYEKVHRLWASTPGLGIYDTDDSEKGIEKFLKRNPDTCFVAADGEKIAGSILVGSDGRRAYIYHTAVHPDYRRQGVGKSLVRTALDALAEMGIRKAALVVFCSNDLGGAFWEKMGFKVRKDLDYRDIQI